MAATNYLSCNVATKKKFPREQIAVVSEWSPKWYADDVQAESGNAVYSLSFPTCYEVWSVEL